MLKLYQIPLLCLLSVNAFSQADSLNVSDSVDTEIDLFRKKVTKIELVQLELICSIEKRRTKDWGRKKKVNICNAQSVIYCTLLDSINDVYSCNIEYERLLNHTPISQNEIDSVFSILYDSENVRYLAVCYSPRHGIIMYDSENVPIGFVEICFECDRTQAELQVPDFGLLPGSAFEKLRTLFDKYGL